MQTKHSDRSHVGDVSSVEVDVTGRIHFADNLERELRRETERRWRATGVQKEKP